MRALPAAFSAVAVPLLSIVGGEVWQLTANLRYRVAPASPSATMDAVVYEAHGEAREALRVDRARAQPATTARQSMPTMTIRDGARAPSIRGS